MQETIDDLHSEIEKLTKEIAVLKHANVDAIIAYYRDKLGQGKMGDAFEKYLAKLAVGDGYIKSTKITPVPNHPMFGTSGWSDLVEVTFCIKIENNQF